MKTFKQYILENHSKIYTASEIADYLRYDLSTPENDSPDYYIELMLKQDAKFKLVTINIEDLLESDPSLMEYVESEEDRYLDSEYEPHWSELDNPIVIFNGECIDGYNRTASKYKSGETTISAYVSI